jgi:hypothetical protein
MNMEGQERSWMTGDYWVFVGDAAARRRFFETVNS